MTDSEIAALVAAVRTVVDEQSLAVRAQVASLGAAVEAMRTEVARLRGADVRAERMLHSFAEQAGQALPVAVAQAVQRGSTTLAARVDVLEQRAAPTASTQ